MDENPHPGPAAPPPADGPRVSSAQVRDVGRLRRPTEDRKIAGVAAGLARHLDVDPLLLRITFVVLAFFGGAGLVLYAALWLLLPEDGSDQAPLHLDERSRGIAVIGAGVLAALLVLGDSWNLYWFPWPLALVALAVWFFFFRHDAPGSAEPAQQPAPPRTYTETYGPAAPPAAGSYAETYAPVGPAYAAPTYAAPAVPPTRPRDPRKRGPVLFWFTCALVALAVGALGVLDLAGLSVPDSAYPALALALIAAMLLVGSFYGRAGGLIALGLVALVATAGALAVEKLPGERIEVVPVIADDVSDTYELRTGELVLDLREVEDLDALDGRALRIEGGVGRIEVLLPEGLDAEVDAEVGGPGRLELFDSLERGGIDLTGSATSAGPGTKDQPSLDLDVEIGVGEIVVRTRAQEAS
ncbi:PspC domain-containing protein [Nocardioides campestrisoli]|uniref:PspC domain-containing protein n=1 Tax=Nocardioides campestrisoli TaxID=2736757 RepID=UPI0015E6BE5F|nr:PspC domain-containing protein [Nocardioides campestrisoli]